MAVTPDTKITTLTLTPGGDPNDLSQFEKSNDTKGLMPKGGFCVNSYDARPGRHPLNYVLTPFRDKPATPQQPVKSVG